MRAIFTSLKTPVPAISAERAHELLADRYGLVGELSPLSSERDQNFLVDAGAAGRFVLKFAGAAEPAGVTEFQNRALQYIAHRDSSFPAPRVIATLDAELQFEETTAAGSAHQVRLLSWLNGVPLDEASGVASVARQMGTTLARLGQLLEDFEHPDARYELAWDIHNVEALADLLSFVADPELRRLCESRVQRFSEIVIPCRHRLRSQVIYNDMNPSNLLVDPDNVDSLVGVIDFGDMVHSELINDVAIAAAYLCRVDDDPYVDVVEFLAAYTDVEPLLGDEIDLLPELIAARHLTTVMISHWRSAMYPENRDYILRSEKRARRMLETISGPTANDSRVRFRDACRAR